MPRKSKPAATETVGLIGVGLDNTDGHKRVTKADDFILLGGSAETHERMQDVAIHVTESLDKKGKRLQDACVEEMVELIHNAMTR